MNYKLRVAWLIGCVVLVAVLLPGADGDATAGKAVFDQQCSLCHYPDKTDVKVGPGLKGLFKKAKMTNGQAPTVENVMKIINEGGTAMPPYGEILKAPEKANVLAYLQTL